MDAIDADKTLWMGFTPRFLSGLHTFMKEKGLTEEEVLKSIEPTPQEKLAKLYREREELDKKIVHLQNLSSS